MNRFSNALQVAPWFEQLRLQPGECYPHVYLIHPRTFLEKNEPIYKIGQTNDPQKRFRTYECGSELMVFVSVDNSLATERRIKTCFKEEFKQMRNHGTEFFFGDGRKMVVLINNIVNQERLISTLRPGLGFYLKRIFKPLPPLPTVRYPSHAVRSSAIRRFKQLPVIQPPVTGIDIPAQSLSKKPKISCPKCNASFKSWKTLNQHRQRKAVPCDFTCLLCGVQLANRMLYVEHQKVLHPTTVKARKQAKDIGAFHVQK